MGAGDPGGLRGAHCRSLWGWTHLSLQATTRDPTQHPRASGLSAF